MPRCEHSKSPSQGPSAVLPDLESRAHSANDRSMTPAPSRSSESVRSTTACSRTRSPQRPTISLSSSTLAREHGQCGWRKIKSVGRVPSSGITQSARPVGERPAASARRGRVSLQAPATASGDHSRPKRRVREAHGNSETQDATPGRDWPNRRSSTSRFGRARRDRVGSMDSLACPGGYTLSGLSGAASVPGGC